MQNNRGPKGGELFASNVYQAMFNNSLENKKNHPFPTKKTFLKCFCIILISKAAIF